MSNNSSVADHSVGLDYILLLRFIIWGYIGMILSLFGIAGNIVTVLVLISPSMRTTSTNIYLTALSCSNILFLLIFIPSYSLRYLIGYELYKTNQPPFAFEILLQRLPTTPIYNTILLSIIYLTIAVSTDRLILVIFPLKAKRILTQRATLITILLIYIFCIVYCIPYWLEQRYAPEVKHCILTSIGERIYKFTRIYFYIPIVYFIPFVTLSCINATIIQNLIDKKRRKKNLCGKANKKKQADYHITLMLVAVIIVFVLCQLPLLILNVWHAIHPKDSSKSFVFQSLNIIGILLMVFNTSTNFLLYCFFGQKFRQTLIEFILKISPNHHKQNNTQLRISKMIQSQPLQSYEKKLRIVSENAAPKRITSVDTAPERILPVDATPKQVLPVDAAPERVLLVDAALKRISSADAVLQQITSVDAAPKRISSTDTALKQSLFKTVETTKSNQLNQEPTVDEKINEKVPNEKLNHTLLQNAVSHQDESQPLIKNTEQVSVINEDFPAKSNQQFKLYAGPNGKRVLVLKI